MGALTVDEGVEPSGERGDGLAVARCSASSSVSIATTSWAAGWSAQNSAARREGGEVELEVLDVDLAVVSGLAGGRVEAGEPLGDASDGLEPVAFAVPRLAPLLLGRGELLGSIRHDLAPPPGGV
jgi:hypothetical protein